MGVEVKLFYIVMLFLVTWAVLFVIAWSAQTVLKHGRRIDAIEMTLTNRPLR